MFGFTSRPRAQELAAPAQPAAPNQQAVPKPSFLQTLDLVLGGRTFTDARYELEQREMARQQAARDRAKAERQMALLDEASRFAMGGGMGGGMASAPVDNRAVTAVRPDDFTSAGYDVATPRAAPMAGGQVPMGGGMGGQGRTGTSRDFLPFALAGAAAGVPQLLEMHKLIAAGDPELDKGQMWQGNRVISAPGFDAATAGTASAVSGAQEQAKSIFDLVEVPLENGQTQMMTRFEAAQRFGGGGAMPQSSAAPVGGVATMPLGVGGQGARAPQGGAGVGVRPSAAQVAGATAQATGEVGLDIAAKERRAAAASALPDLEAKSNAIFGVLDSIRNHPAARARTGTGAFMPPLRESDRAFDALTKQVAGNVFLQAFESLKGAGTITEYESQRGEEALARLSDPSIGYDEYMKAIDEFEDWTRGVLERQRTAAGRGGSAQAQPLPSDTSRLKPGTVYQTRRGPLLWNGREFEAR